MSGMQKLVVVVSLLMVLSIFAGMAGAFWMRQRWPRLRWPFVVLLTLAMAMIVASVVASSTYPGPSGQYLPGSIAQAVRERFVYPSGMLILAAPVLIALAVSYFVPGGTRRASIVAGAAGIFSIPLAFLVLLYIGCSYAGACF